MNNKIGQTMRTMSKQAILQTKQSVGGIKTQALQTKGILLKMDSANEIAL